MVFWLALLVVFVLLAVALVVVLALRARGAARAELARVERPSDHETRDPVLLPPIVRHLKPAFQEAVDRLRKTVRGIDFRYGVPWYLLIGPADSGKTTLVSRAPRSSVLEIGRASCRERV